MSKTSKPEQTDRQPGTALKSGKPLYRSKELSPRQRLFSLVLGDILCFLIFAYLGSTQHGTGIGFDLLHYTWVALPFMIAWFIVSPFMGAFKAELATRPKQMVIHTVRAWVATWPLAMLIRWLVDYLTGKSIPFANFLVFAVIVLLANMAILIVWRWPFAVNNELRSRGH